MNVDQEIGKGPFRSLSKVVTTRVAKVEGEAIPFIALPKNTSELASLGNVQISYDS